jgi:hypothetical protein
VGCKEELKPATQRGKVELIGLHREPTTKGDLASGTLDE